MDKKKVKKFKRATKELAQAIAVAHGDIDFKIDFLQVIPSKSLKRNNYITINKNEFISDKAIVRNGKSRLFVIMRFSNCRFKCANIKKIGKILKRQFTIKKVKGSFEIIISFKPDTIAQF